MPDWLSGGLPIGMLFMAVTVLGVLRRQAGNVVARQKYPALAQRLGLRFIESKYKKGVGRLEGIYQGYQIIVDPDDQRRIYLRFARSPAIELRSYAHNKKALGEQSTFRPASSIVSTLFKTAHASASLREALNGSSDLPRRLRPLKFVRELKTLTVSSSGIAAIFEYGNPPYIPASIVEDVLPRLAFLASVIEPMHSESAPSERVKSEGETILSG